MRRVRKERAILDWMKERKELVYVACYSSSRSIIVSIAALREIICSNKVTVRTGMATNIHIAIRLRKRRPSPLTRAATIWPSK